MAKIHVYYLASRRPQAFEILAYFLKKIKNKDSLKFYILCDYDINTKEYNHDYDNYAKELCEAGLDAVSCPFFGPHRNYMSKIEYALAQNAPYSVKLDEDCFMSENVWDYMIENCEALEDSSNLVMTPVLSNGIPGCDYFMDDFLDANERADIQNNYFIKTKFGPLWGVDYTLLNAHTVNANSWNAEAFYRSVAGIGPDQGGNHFFKGIHPVRINYQANRRVNDYIVGKWNKFCDAPKSNMFLLKSNRPYLCNSIFMIKTSTWKTINGRKDLFRDDYDEVPLNLYKQENNLNWLFVRHGYALHTIYNTVQRYDYENEIIAYVTNLVRGRKEAGI